ncbi:hypothetical protein GCM10008018_17600 [Paenibacillus marchantiophytorum]|uniref:HAMP domain-containing protein n=1 Tax=Paenibacillus marchantiophytorum TaxID=1619310 RepID=A0ABQ2BSE2_9BACL|nr:histidine kinase [Paenibacillus marchantiophytorum]GGI46539.1 hypothetical protein GCM10008018_17600 [Paenibacillus marchantiophytorum]
MKFKRIRIKILIAMLLTTGIPISILAGIIVYQVSQSITSDAEQAKTLVERDMFSGIEDFNQNLYDTAYQIYYNFDLLESLRSFSDYQPDNSHNYDSFRDTKELFLGMYNNAKIKDILGIYLINSVGESKGSFFSYVPVSYSGLPQPYLKGLIEESRTHAAQGPNLAYRKTSLYDQPIYQYVVPLIFQGEQVGALVIDVNVTSFQQSIEKYNTLYKGEIIISNPQKSIVYHTDANQILTQLETDGISSDNKVVKKELSKFGWELLYLYKINPNLLFFKNLAFAVIIGAISLMMVFSLTLSYGITKPIIGLHRNMLRIQLGDFSARTEVFTKDEIGFLGNQFNQMAEQIQQLIDHDFKLQLLNKETQIKALQAQISPHFLHNTLQTMSNLATVENAPEIKLICQCLSNMYRYNMNIEDEWATLKDEIKHIRNYLFIIRKRYPGMLTIKIRVSEELQNSYVPRLILQPLIENSIDHGLIPSRRDKKLLKLYVRRDLTNNKLKIYLVDNGRGMTKKALHDLTSRLASNIQRDIKSLEERHSIGLQNVHARLQLLCGKEYGLRVFSKPEAGTMVVIELPLPNNQEVIL